MTRCLTKTPEVESDVVAVDVETHEGKLALLQFSDNKHTQIVKVEDLTVEFMQHLLKRTVLGFNFHFDLAAIAHWAGKFLDPSELIDLKTSFHLKHPRKPASLKEVCSRYGIDISKEEQLSDWSGDLTQEQLEYAAEDVEVLFKLRQHLKSAESTAYFRLESGFVSTCAYMQFCGINVDDPSEMISGLETRFKSLEVTFKDGLFDRPVNHNSHVDVKRCFLEKHGIKLLAANVVELRRLVLGGEANRDIETILAKRRVEKSIQYLRNIKKLRVGGKVHPQYNPLVRSVSGRSSCKNPNVQNPPGAFAQSKIRSIFTQPKGFYYFDLPNIHARIAAELSQDEQLGRAFKNDLDLHSITGSNLSYLFGDRVTYEEFVKLKGGNPVRHIRDVSKNVFYGCLNGQGVEGLGFSLRRGGITADEELLKRLLKETRSLYSRLTEYIKDLGLSNQLQFIDGFRINVYKLPYNDKISITWLHYEAVFMKYILNTMKRELGPSVEINNFMHDSAMFSTGIPRHVFEFHLQQAYGRVMSWFFRRIPFPALEIKQVKEMPL